MLFTMGHERQSLESLARIMRANRITFLVDVRSKPFSRQREFCMPALREALCDSYIWRPDLGGLDGNVISEESLSWLGQKASIQNILIMCKEDDPDQCHRSKIAQRLRAHGVKVEHLTSRRMKATHPPLPVLYPLVA